MVSVRVSYECLEPLIFTSPAVRTGKCPKHALNYFWITVRVMFRGQTDNTDTFQCS